VDHAQLKIKKTQNFWLVIYAKKATEQIKNTNLIHQLVTKTLS